MVLQNCSKLWGVMYGDLVEVLFGGVTISRPRFF
jgi:hypothetical protein